MAQERGAGEQDGRRRPAERAALVEAVTDQLDLERAVALVQELCRIPSVLGEEGELAGCLADIMSSSGFEGVTLQPVLPDRPNAVGHVDLGPGRRVVLTGHMDTKPVSQGWQRSTPFSGEVLDGMVYGHGVMDMKAALACQIVAVEAVARSGAVGGGTLAVAAVADHMGDQRGSIAYFEEYSADLCVLGEPTDNRVCRGHRGRYYFDVTARGRSAHTCHKEMAVNANVLAAQAILSLDRSHFEPRVDESVLQLFGAETYIVPGRVYGGLPPGGPSMIPDECVIRVDCRPQPGVTVDDVRAEVDRCLESARRADPRFLASVELVDAKPGYLAPAESEVIATMREALKAVRGGPSPEPIAENWLGDTASFGAQVPTVIFGPGGPPVYCPDEHLSITEIHEATRAYAAFSALALAGDTTR